MNPYILPTRKEAYGALEEEVKATRIDTPGELVYLFDRFADIYMEQHLREFSRLNDCMGAFFNAALEFWWKRIRPYEDKKENDNGTIWGPWRDE